MNFVRAETLVQEITADGKIRDIVTERVKSVAEKEAERKEDIIRNLPEFKRERELQGGGDPLTSAFEEEKPVDEKKSDHNKRGIDEDEYEHYQALQERERGKMRERLVEETAAIADFDQERKRLRDEGADAAPDFLARVRQHQQQQQSAKARSAAPTAAERLRGRIVVRRTAAADAADGGADAGAAAPNAPPEVKSAASGGLGLGGYASDSDDE